MKLLFILLLVSNFCFAQTKQSDYEFNNSGASKINFVDTPEQAKELAYSDIKNNKIFIFLHSGIEPIIYQSDISFENKYNLHFNELGCIGSELAINYNLEIFNYLYKAYGKKWIKEIRKDTLGFKKWKTNNKQ